MGRPVKFDVVGMNHRVLPGQRRRLEAMVEVKPLKCDLEREPKNIYDTNAVKVVVNDLRWNSKGQRFHIGYIRRGTATVLADGMDKGRLQPKLVRLVEVNAKHGWGRVSILFSKSPASKRKLKS